LNNSATTGKESFLTRPQTSAGQETAVKRPDSKLRLLHFVPRVPWPLNTGAKLRNYHLAREIARRARVTLLAFAENGAPADDKDAVQPPPVGDQSDKELRASQTPQDNSSSQTLLASPESFYDRVVTINRDQGYTLSKIIRGAIGRTPLPVLNYTTPAMKRELARLLSAEDFDIVQIESIHLAEYLPIIRAASRPPLIICDWHNIESELMSRYSERQASLLRRTYARRASRQMNDLERRSVRDFDAHVVVSGRDGARLLEIEPEARVFVIENGVDTSYYTDERIRQAHEAWLKERDSRATGPHADGEESSPNASGQPPRRIAFVGSMDYHANVDAVVSFAREIWPRLREQQPRLIFTIVGRDPDAEVRQLAALPGIEVTGTIDDVRPYYYEMLAAVIPLRVGGGSRLKILEAMAAGVPVVSTTLGAEGLDVEDGKNILIAEQTEEFCAAIRGLVENEEQRRKLIAGGRALVFEQYDWSRLGALLFEKYESLLGQVA
jgi:polysaccharide biosynthesis protein PslH